MSQLKVLQVYEERNKPVYFNVTSESDRRTIADVNFMYQLKQQGHTFKNATILDKGRISVDKGVVHRVLKFNPVSMQNFKEPL